LTNCRVVGPPKDLARIIFFCVPESSTLLRSFSLHLTSKRRCFVATADNFIAQFFSHADEYQISTLHSYYMIDTERVRFFSLWDLIRTTHWRTNNKHKFSSLSISSLKYLIQIENLMEFVVQKLVGPAISTTEIDPESFFHDLRSSSF